MSVKRSAATFAAATVLGHSSQLVWLAAGSRAMSPAAFGQVLAAQALYAVLQILVDIGTATLGARTAARGELTDAARGELVRVRMTLVVAAAPIALVLGALGISGSLVATAPFVGALVLFGAFNVWEPYGRGDARPWATYMFLRSGLLAAVATSCALLAATFPVALAGLLECAVLAGLMVLSRQRPLRDLRLALAGRRGPWRAVLQIGAPPVMAQTSMAAGTLILSGSGSPSAAGIFAACVRLLSGLNAVGGILATAMYPRLAQARSATAARDAGLVTIGLRCNALLAAGATGVCVLAGTTITTALLGTTQHAAATALVLTAAAALPLGNIIMFSYRLVASGHERDSLLPFAVGAVTVIGCDIVAVAVAGPRVGLVGGALLGGQLLAQSMLALRVVRRSPELIGAAVESTGLAALVALLACASLADPARAPAGVCLLAVAAAMLWRLAPEIRAIRGRS